MLPMLKVENYALWAQVATACATTTYTIWIIGVAIRNKYFPPCPVDVIVRAKPMGSSRTICRCDIIVTNRSAGSVDIPHISTQGEYKIGLLGETDLDSGQFAEFHDVLQDTILVGADREFFQKDAFLLMKPEHVSWFHAKLRMRLWVRTSKERNYKIDVMPYFLPSNVSEHKANRGN